MNKCRIINQFGDKSFYIEKNQGTIYINEYIAESSKAFEDFSFELVDYRPTIISDALTSHQSDLIY